MARASLSKFELEDIEFDINRMNIQIELLTINNYCDHELYSIYERTIDSYIYSLEKSKKSAKLDESGLKLVK